MTPHGAIQAGEPGPLGATWDGGGVNFAVFSQNATRMELCLFSRDGVHEAERSASAVTGWNWSPVATPAAIAAGEALITVSARPPVRATTGTVP